jgi:hypothetical protein
MIQQGPIHLGELCRRIGVPNRHARYVLEEGFLPEGVQAGPGHGNHRLLTPSQAFWIAIVLRLKASGVQAPLAARIAEYARQALRLVTREMYLEPHFAPFDGRLETERRWAVEVGDLRYVRLVTDAVPDGAGGFQEFPWVEIGQHKHAPTGFDPMFAIRVNLARIAEVLRA